MKKPFYSLNLKELNSTNFGQNEKDEMEEQQTQQNPTADGEYEQVVSGGALLHAKL
jgi:hypothetical protein